MTPLSVTYVLYLAASVYITVWVGRRLHRGGCPFLADVFPRRPDVARGVNDALLTGYYLVNVALDVLLLRRPDRLEDAATGVEWLSERLGIVLVTLGTMHLVNVVLLLVVQTRLRRRGGGRPH